MSGVSRPRLQRRWKADVGDHVIALAWAPTGKLLAAASVSGPVTLFDPATGQVTQALAGHGFGTTALSWRHDGGLLASAGQDSTVRLWNPATGVEAATVAGGAAWVEHVCFHPTRDCFASAAGRRLRLWSSAGEMIRDFPDQPATIADITWRPGSGELTSAAYGGVTLWSIESGEVVHHLAWTGSILTLAWGPSGRHLAHGNQDGTVHYWTLPAAADLQMAGYPMKVRQLAWDPTGRYLATGGGDAVTVWDCAGRGPEGSTPLTFEEHAGPVAALAYQRAGPLLASGGQDGRVFLLQPGKFKKSLARSDVDAAVSHLAWSPDGRALAAGTEAGGVVVYSAG